VSCKAPWRCKAQILDVFAKFRKDTAKFVRAVHPSVRMQQLGSHLKEFHEILYWSNIRRYVEEIQVTLKSDKNNLYFTLRPTHIFYPISLSSS